MCLLEACLFNYKILQSALQFKINLQCSSTIYSFLNYPINKLINLNLRYQFIFEAAHYKCPHNLGLIVTN